MRNIRIGNDIDILWGIFTGDGFSEVPYDMTGKDISLYAQTRANDIFEVVDFEIDRHIVKWKFKGKDQRILGTYKITLIENNGRDNMHTIDHCKAFQLVDDSCKATCDCNGEDNLRLNVLEFRSKMSVGYPTTDSPSVNITVDDRLSTESANPVQNKVITTAVNDLIAQLAELSNTVEQHGIESANEINLLKSMIEQIQSGNTTDGIDSLAEIKAFLAGIKDKETLEDKLIEAGGMDETLVQQIASEVVEEAIKDIDGEITPTYDESSGKLTLS